MEKEEMMMMVMMMMRKRRELFLKNLLKRNSKEMNFNGVLYHFFLLGSYMHFVMYHNRFFSHSSSFLKHYKY